MVGGEHTDDHGQDEGEERGRSDEPMEDREWCRLQRGRCDQVSEAVPAISRYSDESGSEGNTIPTRVLMLFLITRTPPVPCGLGGVVMFRFLSGLAAWR